MIKAERLADVVLQVFDPRVSGEKSRFAEAGLEELSVELLQAPRVGVEVLTDAIGEILARSGIPAWQREQALAWVFRTALEAGVKAGEVPAVAKAIEDGLRGLEKGPERLSSGFFIGIFLAFFLEYLRNLPRRARAA